MRVAITNQTAGILSDKMLGRADLARYLNGCLVLENFHIDPTGEWGARQGLIYCGRRKYSDKQSLLVDYSYSSTQSYILEVGDLYMRVFKDGGLVLNPAGDAIYEIVMPYTEAQLDALWWTASADVLYLLHEKHEPRQLVRRDHNDWTISVYETLDGPYLKENTTASKTLATSAASGSVTITAAGHAPFTEDLAAGVSPVGRLIRWNNGGGVWSWLKITARTSDTVVTATVRGANLVGASVTSWRLGVYHTGRWPTTGRLMDGRLMLGGAAEAPDRTDGSAQSDYPTFSPGSNDADAFSWTLSSQQVNRIVSYASAGELIVLTAGSLWRMSGQTERSAITPNGVSAKKLSGHGATSIPPAEVTDAILWIDRSKRKLLRLQLNPDGLQGWAVNDLTVLSGNMAGRHRGRAGFVSLAWQPSPAPTVWALRRDGIVAGLTYLPEEKVSAWQTQKTFEGDEIEQWRVIPGPDGSDQAYAAVKRIINGEIVRTVEVLEWDNLLRSQAEERRLDCCLTYDRPEAADLTLAALTGASVAATASADTWVAGDVGREIRACVEASLDDDGSVNWQWCVGRILSVEGPRACTVKILSPFTTLELAGGTWRHTVTEVSGVELFNGDTVSALLDGQPVHNLPVVDGRCRLPQRASIVHIGRRYRARGLTLPIDVGTPPGAGQGRKARVDKIMLRVRDSIGGRVGAWKKGRPTRWVRTGLPKWNWAAGAPPLPVSADETVNAGGDWTTRPQVIFEQNEPLPFYIQLLNPNIYAPWAEI